MATYQARSGKIRAIVRRKGFKPESRTFPTKTAAKEWATRIERELALREAKGDSAGSTMTVTEVVDWYVGYVRDLKTISDTQKGNLDRIKEGLGIKIASKLTAADITEHVRNRRTGKHRDKNGILIPKCGGATMNVELSFLGTMLRLASSVGVLTMDVDPVAAARPALRTHKMVAKPAKRNRRPTSTELDRLYDYFDANTRLTIPMRDIVEFAIGTAKRESEITRLLWSDLDETNRTALLRDAKHPREKEGNHRRFPLLGPMWDLVQRQPKTSKRIFPYKADSVGTAFRRARDELGIEDLRFHDLRHEATSQLFEAGYSIEEVATVTLHESWTELKRYTQIRPESLHREPKKMGESKKSRSKTH